MLIETQKKILMCLNEELSIKHHIFIKDSQFEVKPNLISWMKYLSISKVYVSYLTVDQMIYYMDEYFHNSKRTVREYHKAMVLLSEAETAFLIKVIIKSLQLTDQAFRVILPRTKGFRPSHHLPIALLGTKRICTSEINLDHF